MYKVIIIISLALYLTQIISVFLELGDGAFDYKTRKQFWLSFIPGLWFVVCFIKMVKHNIGWMKYKYKHIGKYRMDKWRDE